MKLVRITFSILILSLVVVACKKEKMELNFPENPITNPGSNTGNSQSTGFAGRITDVDNIPIAGVLVSIQGQTALTDANGIYHLFNVEANTERAYLTFKKEGYFDGSKALKPRINAVNRVDSKLMMRAQSGVVYNGLGGIIGTGSGVQLQFDPGDVAYPDGTPYTGGVKVYVQYINPTDPIMLELMPGDLQAINSSDEMVFLKSFGMVVVELADEMDNELNVASGQTIGINFPIQPAQDAEAPATIPMWYFSEDQSYWIEEGEAEKIGSVYHAEVAHFTFWNTDIPYPSVDFKVEFRNLAGEPVPNYPVQLKAGTSYQGYSYTNEMGIIHEPIPADMDLTMLLKSSCNTILLSEDFNSATDIDLGIRTIDSESIGVKLTANVDLCGEENGYFYVEYWNDDIYGGFYTLITNGAYEHQLVNCDVGDLNIRVWNYYTGESSPIFTVPTSGDVDLGNIFLCTFGTGSEVEFIQTYLNGVESYIVDTNGTSINFGFPFTTVPDSAVLAGNNSTSNQIYMSIGNFTGVGSYSNCSVISYNDAPYFGTINFNCTRFESIGGYVEGTYSGTIQDIGGLSHTINGSFRSNRAN